MAMEFYGDEKKRHMLEIDILRNSSLKRIGCPEGWILRVWVSKKDTLDSLLAKTMFATQGMLEVIQLTYSLPARGPDHYSLNLLPPKIS